MPEDNLTASSWVPTADQINSIKPDQAVEYWSGLVGMSGRGRSGRSALFGLPTRYFLTCQTISSSGRRPGKDRELIVKQSCGDRIDIFYTICRDDRAVIGEMSCGGRVLSTRGREEDVYTLSSRA
ncbi:hypothetical protein DPMN_029460 [Dreissena polymorpha]|uniref:Uncharacterized protein n=1 Tax=Dreissena polymorpha TaxID=45954 RepID=A0A9D4RG96_DREPO|nr:hypothetical protein DPMN_029460 [Dreissena polymorpha]